VQGDPAPRGRDHLGYPPAHLARSDDENVLESHAGSLLRSAHVLAQKLVELDAHEKDGCGGEVRHLPVAVGPKSS